MNDSLYIAGGYVSYKWVRSLTLIACVTLIAVLAVGGFTRKVTEGSRPARRFIVKA